jgi:hypothetical protein
LNPLAFWHTHSCTPSLTQSHSPIPTHSPTPTHTVTVIVTSRHARPPPPPRLGCRKKKAKKSKERLEAIAGSAGEAATKDKKKEMGQALTEESSFLARPLPPLPLSPHLSLATLPSPRLKSTWQRCICTTQTQAGVGTCVHPPTHPRHRHRHEDGCVGETHMAPEAHSSGVSGYSLTDGHYGCSSRYAALSVGTRTHGQHPRRNLTKCRRNGWVDVACLPCRVARASALSTPPPFVCCTSPPSSMSRTGTALVDPVGRRFHADSGSGLHCMSDLRLSHKRRCSPGRVRTL